MNSCILCICKKKGGFHYKYPKYKKIKTVNTYITHSCVHIWLDKKLKKINMFVIHYFLRAWEIAIRDLASPISTVFATIT